MEEANVTSLADQHPRKRYVGWLLWGSLILLVIGLFAPMMTLKKFLFLKVEVHAAIYFFAASVLASMAASLLINRLVHPGAETASASTPSGTIP